MLVKKQLQIYLSMFILFMTFSLVPTNAVEAACSGTAANDYIRGHVASGEHSRDSDGKDISWTNVNGDVWITLAPLAECGGDVTEIRWVWSPFKDAPPTWSTDWEEGYGSAGDDGNHGWKDFHAVGDEEGNSLGYLQHHPHFDERNESQEKRDAFEHVYLHIQVKDKNGGISTNSFTDWKDDNVMPVLTNIKVSDSPYIQGNRYWVKRGNSLRIQYTWKDSDTPNSGESLPYQYYTGVGSVFSNTPFSTFYYVDNGIPDPAYNSANISYTYFDNNLDLLDNQMQTELTAKFLTDNIHSVLYYLRDKAYTNTGWQISNITIGVDGVAPSGVFSPNSSTWDDKVIISFNPSDNYQGSGVKKWRYRLTNDNGATWGQWSSDITGDVTRNITLSSTETWKIQAEVTDNVDLTGTVTSGSYQIDANDPTGTFTPNSAAWRDTDTSTIFNPSDTGGSGVNKWKYRTSDDNGATWNPWIEVVGDTTKSIPLSGQGLWRVQAYVYDKAGNSSELIESGSFKIDKTLPTGTLTPNSADWRRTNISPSFDPNDPGTVTSGVDKWKYRTSDDNGATWSSTWTEVEGNTTQAIPLTTQGIWKIQAYVYDIATNTSTIIESDEYKIDKTDPSGVFSPRSSDWTNDNISTIFNPSDTGGSGVKRWIYRTSDDNGDSWSSWTEVVGDTTKSIPLSGAGLWKVQAYVYDNAGNDALVESGLFKIETTKPAGVFTPSSSDWTNDDVITTFNPSDTGGSGVKEWKYRTYNGITWSGWTVITGDTTKGITLSGPGEWEVQAYVYDKATNVSSLIEAGPFKIATGTTGGKFTPNSANWTNDDLSTSFDPIDKTGAGIDRWYYKKSANGGTTWDSTWTRVDGDITKSIPLIGEGLWKVQAVVYDNAGNNNLDNPIQTGLFKIDKTKPSGTFSPNYSDWRNTSMSVSFNPSDNAGGSGVEGWKYRKSDDNGATWDDVWIEVDGDTTKSIPLTGPGLWKIQVVVYDVAGNNSNDATTGRPIESGTYKIETTKPSGTFTPKTVDWKNTDITTNFNPSDTGGSGVKEWKYRTYNGSTWSGWTIITGDISKDITFSSAGQWKIEAVVYDKAGNHNELDPIDGGPFKIEATKPSGAFSPISEDWRNTSTSTTFNPSDTGGSGVKSWKYRRSSDNGVTWDSTWTTVTGDVNGTIRFTGSGQWKVQVVVYDKAGNNSNDALGNPTLVAGPFKIETTKPSGIFSPFEAEWRRTGISTTFNPSDAGGSGVEKWVYRTSDDNGATWNPWSAEIIGDTSQSIPLSSQGVWKVQAIVYDNAGNTSSTTSPISSGEFRIDTTKPSGTFSPNSAAWRNTEVVTTFTPSDTGGSEVKSWKYRKSKDDGATWETEWTEIEGSDPEEISITGTGMWKIQVVVYDNAGNNSNNITTGEAIESGTFKIDMIKPTGKFVPNSSGWRNTDTSTTFTPSDTGGSGVKSWKYRTNNGSAWSEWIPVTGGVSKSIPLSGEGILKVDAVVYDNATNSSYTIRSGDFKIDKTKPSGTFSPTSAAWRNTDTSTTFTPKDNVGGSGVASWKYRTNNGSTWSGWTTVTGSVSQSIPLSGQGEWKVQVIVYDVAGNVSDTLEAGDFQIDKTKPDGTFSPTSAAWRNTDTSTTFTPSDTGGSGVKNWKYRTYNGSTWSGWTTVTGNVSKSIPLVGQGIWKVETIVYDVAGNISDTLEAGDFQIDKTKPSGTFSPTSAAWRNTDTATTFTPSDTGGSGVKEWKYRTYNGSTWSGWTTVAGNVSKSIPLVGQGIWKVEAIVYDVAGNISDTLEAGDFQIDKTKPSGTFSPTSAAWRNIDTATTFTPIDTGGSGVKEWKYRKYNGTTWTTWTTVTGNVSQSIPLSGEGEWKVEAIVYDVAGNVSITLEAGDFQIDKTKSNGTFSPTSAAWRNTDTATIFTPSDTGGSGVKEWKYRKYNGTTWTTWTTVIGNVSQSIPLSGQGEWKVEAIVYDVAGNVSVTLEAGDFQIDKTKPSGTFSPTSATWRNTDTATTFTPSDTGGSGVKEWKYRKYNGTTWTTWTTVAGNVSQSIPLSGQGEWKVEAIVYDVAGNISATLEAGDFQIDKTKPSGTFSPTSATWRNTDTATTFTPSDTGGSGVKEWKYRVSDDNGATWTAATTANDGWITVTGNVSKSIPLAGEGRWLVEAIVYDIARNASATLDAGEFQIDKTNPSGTFTPNSISWINTDTSTSFNPSDTGGSGVNRWKYRTSSDNGATWSAWSADIIGDTTQIIPLSGQGRWKVQALVYDNATNSATITSGEFQIDNTNPGGAFVPNSATWRNTSLSTTFTPTDAGGAGVEEWKYRKSSDNGVTWESTWTTVSGGTAKNILISGQGRWKVQAVVYDTAGNSATITSGEFRIDTTLPNATFTPNSATWRNTSINIDIDPSDTGGSNVDDWKYRLSSDNGATWGPWSTPAIVGDTTDTITLSTQGEWKIEVQVTDIATNVKTIQSGVYQIDKTRPNGIFTPNSVSWGTGDVITVFDPSDTGGSDVRDWKYRMTKDDGVTWSEWSDAIAGDNSSGISITEEGRWKVQVLVYDVAGNYRTITSDYFRIDRTKPYAWHDEKTPFDLTNGDVVITLLADDDASGVKRIILPNGTTVINETEETFHQVNYTVTLNGNYTFIIEDQAGNQQVYVSSVTNIDKNAPKISGVVLYEPQTNRYEVTVNAEDKQGIKEVVLNTGNVLNYDNSTNLFKVTGLTNKPASVTVTDNANNSQSNITFMNAPTVSYESGYDPLKIMKEDVDVYINGLKSLSYLVNGIEVDCSEKPCTHTFTKNGEVIAKHKDGYKAYLKTIEINNIDKTINVANLTGERNPLNKYQAKLKWSLAMNNPVATCQSGSDIVTQNATGTSHTLPIQNKTYDCWVEGTYQGYPIVSNTVVIYEQYDEEIIVSRPNRQYLDLDTDVLMEKTRSGEFYIVNARRSNFEDYTMPLPESLAP